MEQVKEARKQLSELSELVATGDVAMLTTKTVDGHLRSRPMEVCFVSDRCKIFFFAETSDELIADLTDHNHVSLNFINEADDNYTSVSGIAQLSKNNGDMAAFWQNRDQRWVHGGLEDPSCVLIKINAIYAEHWSFSGVVRNIIKFITIGKKGPGLIHEKLYA